jgi:hypothetical protein
LKAALKSGSGRARNNELSRGGFGVLVYRNQPLFTPTESKGYRDPKSSSAAIALASIKYGSNKIVKVRPNRGLDPLL